MFKKPVGLVVITQHNVWSVFENCEAIFENTLPNNI